MEKFNKKKIEISNKLAHCIIENGMKNSSLRQLASAIGTSDRMLLHYYQNKEELMNDVFYIISNKLINILSKKIKRRLSLPEFIVYLYNEMNDKEMSKFMRVSMELMTYGINGDEDYYKKISKRQIDIFVEWIKNSIDVKENENIIELSSFVLILIDGMLLLNSVGEEAKVRNTIEFLQKMF